MRGLLVATLALLGSVPAAAESGFRKGPYLQSVSKTSVTVMFESGRREPAVVDILSPEKRRIEVDADEVNEVVVGKLRPGTRYRYAVTVGDTTATGEFATAPEPDAPFTFVVFGDSRSDAGSHSRVVDRIRAEVPDFLLGTGDMVNEGGRDRDWQRFFDIERELLMENPFFPSVGNHDRQGRGRTADNYRKFFSLPENSPDPERYYAFTYGNSRFVILDSNSYSFALTDQTAWLEEQLQAARLDPGIEHIFVTMHHPPYSVSLHGGQTELREAWTPLFEKYRVDAVFSGHDHAYSRAQRGEVHYYVSGGGGAPLYPRKRNSEPIDIEATKYFERVNHYLRVHVFGGFVEVTAVRADGSVIETMSWGALPKPEPKPVLVAKAAGGPEPAVVSAAPPVEVAGALPARGGFGWLGALGGVLVVLAGAVLWFNLRL